MAEPRRARKRTSWLAKTVQVHAKRLGPEVAAFTRRRLQVLNGIIVGFFWLLFLISLTSVNSQNVGSSAGGVLGKRVFFACMLVTC